MANYPDLRGATVLITGGANGIGNALVRSFHTQGARVFFCDVDQVAGQHLAKELSQEVEFAAIDLREEGAIRHWVTRIGRRTKHIHVLINNAARDPRIALSEITREQWDDLFACNLRALMFTCKAAVKWMQPGSSVINFSSITFHIAPPEMTAYVATKAAILGFTRSLARELGPRRIRVNAISPGWVMTERQLREFITPAVKRLIRRSQCIPDRIQPEEIARIALFLASDGSAAITGQEILADRGWAHS
jgi:NAD(P)-dependent dehydrogenase (short-subunit alcohol dehydrogenase family)